MLIVQNNNGTIPDANGYITLDQFKAYHDDRGNDYSAGADDILEQCIVKATDYLDERFNFVGEKLIGRDQTTSWPRMDAFDCDRRSVLGIPREVFEATAEYALRAIAGILSPDPTRDDTGAVVQSKSEEVGPIKESTTYVSGAVFALPAYPAADQKLRRAGLTRSGNTLARA